MGNIYFELTERFNAKEINVVLTSGQAVVYYRIAMMSKDGDWIIREDPAACSWVLDVLAARKARYRPGAPLDVRWLAGGWSSHFQFQDAHARRVRCDFLSRPPRVEPSVLRRLFSPAGGAEKLVVLDLESLILTKKTQRQKDYSVIAELARLLPEERELLHTTDPDRILALAHRHGGTMAGTMAGTMDRLPVKTALKGGNREEVVVALAREANSQQELDKHRLEIYEAAGGKYLEEFHRMGIQDLPLVEAHQEAVALAARLMPEDPAGIRGTDIKP